MKLSGIGGLDLAQVAWVMMKETKKPSQILGSQGMINPPPHLNQINLSKHGIGHSDYLPQFHSIAMQSAILKPLMSPVP
jgi:hypothetical protein